MSSVFGEKIRVSIFGQSHSKAIGVVVDGLPSGEEIDFDKVQAFMSRRAPGRTGLSTPRKEADIPQVLSGIVGGKTCGAPLCAVIENKDTRSQDYDNLRNVPRPSHSDYTAYVKYGGANDIRGGGHFSGRLTAPLCFAGAVCMQILQRRGIEIGAHISTIGNINDERFDPVNINAEFLNIIKQKQFPVIDDKAGESMKAEIEQAKAEMDSVGGVVEVCAVNVPVGLGSPMFDGVENRLAKAIFGIPAVRGVEFGLGFEASKTRGSQHNDAFYYDKGEVKTRTNNHGGILGGITSGMPIVMRVAFKPTASIGIEQDSVNLVTKVNTRLKIEGRHDPCIVPRAVPCVEAVMAIEILDLML